MHWPQHGSNAHYLYKKMGIPEPEHFIDLSANINPIGPPEMVREKWAEFYEKIGDYPDPFALDLTRKIAEMENIDTATILVGNGGAEMIALIGRFLSGKHVLIVEPTFSEYEQACRANGCTIDYHCLEEPDWQLDVDKITTNLKDIDAVFLCNPNNPTGVQYPNSEVIKLLEECKENQTYLIIDEAFYDFLNDYTPMSPLLSDFNNLIIIRSMTKMFAIPGLRLGYILTNKEVVQALTSYQPHWSVNTVAMLVGEVCLDNAMFVQQTKQFIHSERERLFTFFRQAGFEVSPSVINFYLLQEPWKESPESLFRFLLKSGIVPRHTNNFPGLDGKWLRFAIKGKEENNRLMEVLTEWKQQT